MRQIAVSEKPITPKKIAALPKDLAHGISKAFDQKLDTHQIKTRQHTYHIDANRSWKDYLLYRLLCSPYQQFFGSPSCANTFYPPPDTEENAPMASVPRSFFGHHHQEWLGQIRENLVSLRALKVTPKKESQRAEIPAKNQSASEALLFKTGKIFALEKTKRKKGKKYSLSAPRMYIYGQLDSYLRHSRKGLIGLVDQGYDDQFTTEESALVERPLFLIAQPVLTALFKQHHVAIRKQKNVDQQLKFLEYLRRYECQHSQIANPENKRKVFLSVVENQKRAPKKRQKDMEQSARFGRHQFPYHAE